MCLSSYQRVLTFLFRRPRRSLLSALVTGVASGVCSAALLAVISSARGLSEANHPLSIVLVALCLLALFTKAILERWLIAVGQRMLAELRIILSGEILEIPPHRIEAFGSQKCLRSWWRAFRRSVEYGTRSFALVEPCSRRELFGAHGWLNLRLFSHRPRHSPARSSDPSQCNAVCVSALETRM